MLYLLFVGATSPDRAARTPRSAGSALLLQGGIATATVRTGRQWDAPKDRLTRCVY
jgi:neutral trehalase